MPEIETPSLTPSTAAPRLSLLESVAFVLVRLYLQLLLGATLAVVVVALVLARLPIRVLSQWHSRRRRSAATAPPGRQHTRLLETLLASDHDQINQIERQVRRN